MDNLGKFTTMSQQREMEAVVWKGTFAEAEQRDDAYWMAQSEQARLAEMLQLRAMLFDGVDEPIAKVAFKRKLGEEEE